MPLKNLQFSTQFTSQGALSSRQVDFDSIRTDIVHGMKSNTVRADLQKTIGKPNKYTSKVLIKNLELSKNFVAGVKERGKHHETTSRSKKKHGLLNVGGLNLDLDS